MNLRDDDVNSKSPIILPKENPIEKAIALPYPEQRKGDFLRERLR